MKEMKRGKVQGIAYWEAGEGLPLLAIHGYYPDHRIVSGCLEPLFDGEGRARLPASGVAARDGAGPGSIGYRRIYPDLPLMGASEDPESIRNSDDMLAAVLGFIAELIPEGPFLLAGESYGGYLARGIIRELGKRVVGALFICPLVVAADGMRDRPPLRAHRTEAGYAEGLEPGDVAEFESVAVIRDRPCFEAAMRDVVPGVRLARSERLEALRREGFPYGFDAMEKRRAGASALGDGSAFDARFEGPALFLLGREDASVGWRDALRLAERYPEASYAILSGAGHNLQIEERGLFEALSGAWLARCELALAERRD
jgi:pimeloyl-ACP methyl ester carboxylesterase